MPSAVTVVCTFFNAEETLAATLESLHHQIAEEARFILVDDGATDGSAALARSFCRRDSRFSLHDNPQPGRGRALNFGVVLSDTEYVAILDADDVAHPAWLVDGLAAHQRYPDFVVIGFERLLVRDAEQPVWEAASRTAEVDVRDVTRGLARTNVLMHSGAVICRKALLGVGGYDTARRGLFDYDLWIRLAKEGRRLGVCPLVRVAKRYHARQKFAHSEGYSLAVWRTQLQAILVIDPDWRNFLRLGWRIAGDLTRRPRRALAQGIRRR